MRILHVSEALGGGVLAVVDALVTAGNDRGHDVAVAYGIRPETPEATARAFGDRATLLPPVWTSRSLRGQARGLRVLRETISRTRPDLIHAHSSFSGITTVLTAGGVPTIYTPHGYAFLREDASDLWRRAVLEAEVFVAHRATAIVGCSRSEADVAKTIGARGVRHVCNGIPELDRPVDPAHGRGRRGRPLVTAGGRVSAQRRPLEASRILGALGDLADVRWVGGAGEGGPHRAALDASGIELTGWVPRDEAVRQLQDAAIYLHWTAWDGLPLSILEAFAHNTVVIASDIAPNRELLDHRQVCATEAEAVEVARRVLIDAPFREELLAGQRATAARHGAARMATGWLDVYDAVLEESRTARARARGRRQRVETVRVASPTTVPVHPAPRTPITAVADVAAGASRSEPVPAGRLAA